MFTIFDTHMRPFISTKLWSKLVSVSMEKKKQLCCVASVSDSSHIISSF